MRYSESEKSPPEAGMVASTAEQLRKENEELRRQLHEMRTAAHGGGYIEPSPRRWRPSRITIWAICLGALTVIALAFVAGYVPLEKRRTVLATEAREQEQALPRVEVIKVTGSSRQAGLELPGNIQAFTEAPILARADGYVRRRFVDIGDRVHAGQLLAELEAPELDEQVRQAKASVEQAQAALDQSEANLQQGKSDLELARVTAQRWANLIKSGSVSEQENDQFQAQYRSKIAAVEALEKAVNVQRSAIAAAQANASRLAQMQSYRKVAAPFDGVITVRNIDDGALVNTGSTLLFRIAQIGTLRTYVNVPQSDANSVRVGQTASVTVSNLPGQTFGGTVSRTANALDPASRTLLVEVRVPNPSGLLMPGMYAQVSFISSRTRPPLLIPSDALIVRSNGTQVAVVQANHRVRVQKINVGRDYGDRLEVLDGLHEGDTIVANPSDVVEDGTEVDPVPAEVKTPAH